MILHATQQHDGSSINFSTEPKSTSMVHSEYRRRSNHGDRIDYYNQPSPLPLPDTLPFFKFAKSSDTKVATHIPTTSSLSLNNYHVQSPPLLHNASTHSTHINSPLNSDHIRGSPARSISLDSACYNLPKIGSDTSNHSPKRNEYSLAQSFSSLTPRPSLPPLAETLSNIFTDGQRKPSLAYDTHNTDSILTTASNCYSLASPPLTAGMPNSPSHMLPPIILRDQSPQELTAESPHPPTRYDESHSPDPNYSQDEEKKVFSFVALPGINGKKRPRRKFDEIERLYRCNWQGCSKSYGTLNHLNAHVMMQKHGIKRLPNEFKEMRKHWKKQRDD
ncbi:hypothetical protein K7432_016843 [Basidiobolus ranarum]|uniref:C2H2-type domain-containing protein n=1 Tax=Basidiobolus ranarum TaxID=34480 RepID=A0ABR2VL20_9FUNG